MNVNIIFQECGGSGGGSSGGAYEDGQDRVPDEVGRGGARRRLQVEEVRQEGREEQPQPEVLRVRNYNQTMRHEGLNQRRPIMH
jgi:hypothetical protein